MKIEEGKVYKRRDGLKAFDVVIDDDIASYSFERDGKIRSDVVFVNSGLANYDTRFPYDGDLIEELKEEKMPKFQVGDFVTADGWSNPNGYEIKKIDDKNYYFPDKYGKLLAYPIGWYDNELRLVTQTQKSPVVEKTVKSIEPGVYGKFSIGQTDPMNRVHIIQGDSEMFTAEELESAAKTFMELAEYLRGRG